MIEKYKVQDHDWRTRAIFKSNASFIDEIYPFINSGIRVIHYNSIKSGLNIIECYVREQDFPNIEDAFHFSKSKILDFTDQISIITNDKVDILSFLSTCPMRVSKGVPFNMLIPSDAYIDKNLFEIKAKDLNYYFDVLENPNYVEAIRQVREGLSNISNNSKILFYFSALERIAEFETEEKIIDTCPKCGNIEEKGIATSRYIRTELEKYGVTRKQYTLIRDLRSKIAHGSGRRDITFINKVNEVLPVLERSIMSILSDRCKFDIKSVNKLHVSNDFLLIKAKKIFNKWRFIPSSFVIIDLNDTAKIIVTRTIGSGAEDIDKDGFYGQEYLSKIGRPKIDKECWPY